MLRIPLVLVLLSVGTWAQDAAKPPNHEKLKGLEYLVGGTWVAEGDLQGMGHYSVERTYTWQLDGNFIEQHHVMKMGPVTMEVKGILGWDAQKGKLVAWGFGNDGGVATTEAEPSDKEVHFEGARIGGMNPGPVRGTYQKIGDDQFHEIVEMKKDGNWVPFLTFTFTRKK